MRSRRLVVPSEFELHGQTWKVYQEPNLPPWAKRHRPLAERGIDAATYRWRREIHLAKHLRGRSRRSTFLHELVHAASTRQVIPLRYEEALVHHIEGPLLDALERLVWR